MAARASVTKLAVALGALVAAIPASHRFALVGGLAVSTRAEPRFTRDIDLAISVTDDADAEALVFALRASGLHVEATVEHEKQSRLATARLRGGPKDPIVDLLFAQCGIETEIAEAAEPMVVLGTKLPVAVVGHLIAMKLLSQEKARPRDDQDLVNLAEIAVDADWATAQTAVRLIETRGYARNRDLVAALTTLRTNA